MDWQPSEHDKAWMNNLISVIQDGGVWGVPITGTVFTFNKKTKTVTVTVPGDIAHEIYKRTVLVFKSVGWKVVEPKAN